MLFKKSLICLRTVRRVSPNIRSGVVGGDDPAQHLAVMLGRIGDGIRADKAIAPVNGNMVPRSGRGQAL